ncbi:MAG: hypothetical protein Q9203_003880 [Teloschistes exilis]
MFIDLVRRVITAIKDGMDRAVDRFSRHRKERLTVCMHESSKPEYVYTPDYFDVAVQVNESMFSNHGKQEREFSLISSDDRRITSRKNGKPVIHQDSRRPEVIPEEASEHGHVVKDNRRRSSSTTEPKPVLKDSSRSSSSAESLSSSKPASDLRSSSSKKVSWERLSTASENEKLTRSTSGSTTPQPKDKVDEKASSQVLKLLSGSNQTAFETFRKLCANNGLLDRPVEFSDRDLPEGVNDDATLFRFFTARKCDIHAAYDQFQDSYETRKANDVLGFSKRMDIDDFEESRKLYPEWVGRRDKRGLPILIFDFTKFDSKMINAYKKASPSIYGMKLDSTSEHAISPDLLRAFVVFDNMTRFVLPLCSGAPGGPDPVHKTLHLVDITGIGIRQVWNLRGYIQDLSRLLSRNYPEILDHVFLIGAPSYFSTIWGWVKNWVDPGTVEKLKVLSHAEVLPTLKEYIDVENIPTRFGGQFKYETGMGYDLDPVIARRLVWLSGSGNKLPKGPIKWVRTGDGCKMAVAIGTQRGRERMTKLAVIR